MKKIYRFLIFVTAVMIFCLGLIKFLPRISDKFNYMIERKKEYEYRNKIDEELERRIASYNSIQENNEAWYSKYNFIAHAAGKIEGRIYTNSKEAYDNAYKNGNRIFDADVRFTRDNVLVLRHSWTDDLEQININSRITRVELDDLKQAQIPIEETPNFEEFMKTKIFHKYTPMSFENLLEFMVEHEDVYIVIDAKEDIEKTYIYIVEMAKTKNLESLLDRIIVSFYKYEDYNKIMEIYNFKNLMARQHFVYPHNAYELVEFCLKNRIPVVNISASFIDEGDDISIFLENNIKLYVAVVDSKEQMEKYMEMGCTGAITNCLYESDIKNRML